MAHGVDFLRLYHEFQLEPGASIDDLKLAYRRRVALVHPDRLSSKDPISQHLATEQLQKLTRLYEAGVQFHRQHGRLPGAMPMAAPDRSGPHAQPALTEAPVRVRRRRRGLMVLVAGIGIAALLAFWPFDEPLPEPAYPRLAVPALPLVNAPQPAQREGLRLGMPERVVLEVIGAPVTRETDHWSYGPSWIRFKRGRVVEWYSSPLHPFRISRDSEPWPEE